MKLVRHQRPKVNLGRQASDSEREAILSNFHCGAARHSSGRKATPAGCRRSLAILLFSDIFIPQIWVFADELAHELNALGIVKN